MSYIETPNASESQAPEAQYVAKHLEAPWKSSPKPDPLLPIKQRVLSFFNETNQPLFAILDGARDAKIVPLLNEFGIPANVSMQRTPESQELPDEKAFFQSLYTDRMELDAAEQGPFLVRMVSKSPLLSAAVMKGWTQSWGIYIQSSTGFTQMWRHFRKYIFAETPSGEKALFRFYDPRVLRILLPTFDSHQAESFFAVPKAIFLEQSKGQLVRLTHQKCASEGRPINSMVMID